MASESGLKDFIRMKGQTIPGSDFYPSIFPISFNPDSDRQIRAAAGRHTAFLSD